MGRKLVNTTQVGTVVYAAGTDETEELAAAIPNPAMWTEGEALAATPGTLIGDGGKDDPVDLLAAVIRREVAAALAPLFKALDVPQSTPPTPPETPADDDDGSDPDSDDRDQSAAPKDWNAENLDDLKSEVAARNKDRDDADRITVGGKQNKPDYVAALTADDADRA